MRPSRKQRNVVIFSNVLIATLTMLQQCAIIAINAPTTVATTTTAAAATTTTDMAIAAKVLSHSSSNIIINSNSNSNGTINVVDAAIDDTVAVNDDFERLLTRKLQEEADAAAAASTSTATEHLLSRKRRYLLFPEGSSFQLVWDGIYGIVDFTNYLILGITVALAWELPSKPQGEVIEEIANRLKDGTIDVKRNDTATNLIYVDTKSKTKTKLKMPAAMQKLYAKQQQQQQTRPQSIRPNYIQLATAGSKTSNNYYATTPRWPSVFQPPMHKKYYYYNINNNNNKKYAYQRPTDSYYRRPPAAVSGNKFATTYYKARPSDWRRKDNNYYNNNYNKYNYNRQSAAAVNPFSKWTQRPGQQRPLYGFTPQTSNAAVKYPWWNLASRLSNSLRRKPIPARRIDSVKSQPMQRQRQQPTIQQLKQQSANGYQRQPPPPPPTVAAVRKHRIYPVFGKRSIPDAIPNAAGSFNNMSQQQQQQQLKRHRRSGIGGSALSRMERIHVRHHRSTRQTLFGKIEKYLDKLGVEHSHHCVLRALCETGQKSGERVPGSFVGELMRAVFTLPEALEPQEERVHYKDQRYDAANAFVGDCAAHYGLCKKSLWQMPFVA